MLEADGDGEMKDEFISVGSTFKEDRSVWIYKIFSSCNFKIQQNIFFKKRKTKNI